VNGPEERVLWSEDSARVPNHWSPDGAFLLFVTGRGPLSNNDIWILPLGGDRQPYPFATSAYNETRSQFSPGGRWVAYTSDETDRNEIYVAPFPAAPGTPRNAAPIGKVRVSPNGGTNARWRADGRELFYLESATGTIMVAEVDGRGTEFRVGRVQSLFRIGRSTPANPPINVAPDGQRFLIPLPVNRSDTSSAPTVVLNWMAALQTSERISSVVAPSRRSRLPLQGGVMSANSTAVVSSVVRAPRTGRSRFFLALSALLTLVVLTGFSRTLYLRALFDVPLLPASLWIHGIALTFWFAGAFVQATLISIGRPDLHRRTGWVFAASGLGVFATGLYVTLHLGPRLAQRGVNLELQLARFSSVVWSDFAALLSFAILLPAAIVFRQRPETHKRLMLLSSISVVQPALSRIWRWPPFEGLNPAFLGLGTLLAFVLAIVLYDAISRRRVHAATLLGGGCFMTAKIVGFAIARSEIGLSLARQLG
jgi:hypothetical protein